LLKTLWNPARVNSHLAAIPKLTENAIANTLPTGSRVGEEPQNHLWKTFAGVYLICSQVAKN
jgi:hypothetical protein